jgi:hypothetical protein
MGLTLRLEGDTGERAKLPSWRRYRLAQSRNTIAGSSVGDEWAVVCWESGIERTLKVTAIGLVRLKGQRCAYNSQHAKGSQHDLCTFHNKNAFFKFKKVDFSE